MSRLDALWRVGLAGLVAVIVWASLTPHPLETAVDNGDKLQHLLGYGVLMFWAAQGRGARWRAALACVLLGLAMEGAQGIGGYRQADVFDALANGVGVAMGWLAACLLPGLRLREAVARR